MKISFKKYKQNPIILQTHNYNEPPIGKVEFQKGKIVFKFINKDFKITKEQLTRIEPAYIITKKDEDGNVLECELLEISFMEDK